MPQPRASLSTKVHVACDALGYPLGFILTAANLSDFDQAQPLLRRYLRPHFHTIMAKRYDSDAVRPLIDSTVSRWKLVAA